MEFNGSLEDILNLFTSGLKETGVFEFMEENDRHMQEFFGLQPDAKSPYQLFYETGYTIHFEQVTTETSSGEIQLDQEVVLIKDQVQDQTVKYTICDLNGRKLEHFAFTALDDLQLFIRYAVEYQLNLMHINEHQELAKLYRKIAKQ